jgi:hypothetical protein
VDLGASLDADDDNGQKAIHLAAQADQVRTTIMKIDVDKTVKICFSSRPM